MSRPSVAPPVRMGRATRCGPGTGTADVERRARSSLGRWVTAGGPGGGRVDPVPPAGRTAPGSRARWRASAPSRSTPTGVRRQVVGVVVDDGVPVGVLYRGVAALGRVHRPRGPSNPASEPSRISRVRRRPRRPSVTGQAAGPRAGTPPSPARRLLAAPGRRTGLGAEGVPMPAEPMPPRRRPDGPVGQLDVRPFMASQRR